MRLAEALVELRDILEKEYGLTHVEFRNDLEYKGDYWIPGFSFDTRNPKQIKIVDKLFTRVKREVMKGYTSKEVVCYLFKGGGENYNYREVHVNIKKGDPYRILSDLVGKLTQNLKQKAALKDDAERQNL